MLDRAAAVGTQRPVKWQQADATLLPFVDASFDIVVCQFGVMFFPDKVRAFSEARRVLRRGGVLLFNVWDRIEENEFANTVTTALADLFPTDRPLFHGGVIVLSVRIDTVAREIRRKINDLQKLNGWIAQSLPSP